MKQSLSKILSRHFVRFSLYPILIVEVTLIAIYFLVNYYVTDQNLLTLKEDAIKTSKTVLSNEVQRIDNALFEVNKLARMMQDDHERFFANQNKITLQTNPTFQVAPNGVYYKTNKEGGSLYYSSKTPMNSYTKQKALQSEAIDPLLESIVKSHKDIVAAYFNSYDDMNRLYPYIDKVYEQYGEHIHMEDYNFYFLADLKHNPKKEPVWTEAYLDPAGNSWMVSCVVPIYNKEKLEGVSGLDITIDALTKELLDKKLPYDTKMFLVDTQGVILAMPKGIEKYFGLKDLRKHTYNKAIIDTVAKPDQFNINKNDSSFAKHFKSLIDTNSSQGELEIGEDSLLTFNQIIPQTNWHLMLVVDKNKVFESTYNLDGLYTTIGILLLLFMILFYIVFFYFLTKRSQALSKEITYPIEVLSKETSNVGIVDQKPKLVTSDIKELDILNENFSKMMLELEERTQLLLKQSKNAALGEMMDAIAHQWKQPLSVISVGVSELELQTMLHGKVKTQDLTQTTGMIKTKINHLIETIDEFRKFFRQDTPRENSNIESIIESVIALEKEAIDRSNINIITESNGNAEYSLIVAEFKHVFINMFSNSLYAFEETKNENKIIKITIDNKPNQIEIRWVDSAGGIPDEFITQVFQANKTTKGSKGTGVGLYLSTQIIDKIGGRLSVENIDWKYNGIACKGASFLIVLPK